MRILYIEDEPTSRTLFVTGIRAMVEECEVETAETGEEGLERLRSEHFDLLVTDLMLPGASGLDVLRECRRDRPEMEIIVLTAEGSVRSAVEAMQLGACDYVQKPMDVPLMKEKIENVRSHLSQRAELEDVQEAKDVIERQADREIHLLEARVLRARDAIDEALAVLSGESCSADDARRIREILTPLSSQPDDDDRGSG